MGQAKRRGTFEERKAQAIAKQQIVAEELHKKVVEHRKSMPIYSRRKHAIGSALVLAAMASLGTYRK